MILSLISEFKDFYSQLTGTVKSSYIIVLFLVIILIALGSYFKKQDPMKKPSAIGALVEWYVNWINSICDDVMGKYSRKYAPVVGTLGIFIFLANISGLLGLTTPTGCVFVTLALGLFAGFFIHFAGIKHQGFKAYFKSTFLEPSFIMLPLNIISEILTPFSLALRLFGNILSGGVIMGLVYNLIVGSLSEISPILGVVGAGMVAPAFHAIFDIFFGAIQTYVFVLLTSVFISGKLPEEE